MNGESNYDSLKVAKKSSFERPLEKPKDIFFLHLSSYTSPLQVSKVSSISGPQNKVGKENPATRIRLFGKRIDSENWVQGSMSQDLSCFCLFMCSWRLTKVILRGQNQDALRRVLGSPQLLSTWRGPNHPKGPRSGFRQHVQ